MNVISTMLISSLMALSLYATTATAGHGKHLGFSHAPRGFDNEHICSIHDVLNTGDDKDVVIVKGRLTKYLGDDKYELTDNNNDCIVVELDDDRDWSFIAKDQPIEIISEIDKDLLSTKLEVRDARPLAMPPRPIPEIFD